MRHANKVGLSYSLQNICHYIDKVLFRAFVFTLKYGRIVAIHKGNTVGINI